MNTPINSVGHITFVNLKQGSKGNSSINTGALACIVGVKRGREGGGGAEAKRGWMEEDFLLAFFASLTLPCLRIQCRLRVIGWVLQLPQGQDHIVTLYHIWLCQAEG